MSFRIQMVLSDDLHREIDRVAAESKTDTGEVLRKALQLYLAARDGKNRGLKLGLLEAGTNRLETEIVGL